MRLLPSPIQTIRGWDLSIELSDPAAPLYPGSVIRGHVTRKSHIVAASAEVRVCLIGYAAAGLTFDGEKVYSRENVYSTGYDFWSRNAVSQVIHRGPLHIASESNAELQTWPFALTVPEHTDGKALNAGLKSIEREASYLHALGDPQGKQGLPEQPLPSSQLLRTKDGLAFVEYYLEADLLLDGKRSRPIEATLPVKLSSRPAPALIGNFELQGWTTEGCVTSHRLTPGLEDAKLTFNQKRQMFLGSRRVPTWHFNLRLQCPSVLQFGNPNTLPFRLKVTPVPSKSSTILENVPQKVYLTSVELYICTKYAVSCPTGGDVTESCRTEGWCLGQGENESLLVPTTTEEEALDLGSLFGGLNLGDLTGPPDCTTYCFKRSHSLAWELRFVIAGESWQCRGSQTVVVLPMADKAVHATVDGTAAVETETSPPPAGSMEEPPAYDGPSQSAPSYENAVGSIEELRLDEKGR
ncbi:hypothetical protein CSOJ01_05129 [Colletotrichum sojae]|uniref:Arrestin-like N-terminal domain-containing protein n=1 Tax=Colletotrichum sojae TaxID=2175907 RepID=A0A8H6JFW5_9PEZI|nr:hypothetical protein CSOJ01_05129 [Colletotrichum sojae]